jgi:hypothetical protein
LAGFDLPTEEPRQEGYGIRPTESRTRVVSEMKVLVDAVYRAVKELYDRTKPWGVDFVKFTIDFDESPKKTNSSYLLNAPLGAGAEATGLPSSLIKVLSADEKAYSTVRTTSMPRMVRIRMS